MTTITATPGGDAAEIELTINPTGPIVGVLRTDANGTNPVRVRPGVWPHPLTGTELRRNYCTNPSFVYNVNGWAEFSGAVLTRLASAGPSGTGVARITYPTAGLTNVSGMYGDFPAVVAAGKSVTISAYVRPSVTKDLSFRLELRNAAGPVDILVPPPVTCPANQWTRLSTTVTPTASATIIRCQAVLNTATSTAGMTIDVDAVLVECSVTPGTYFDGDTPQIGATGYAWAGASNASASVEVAPAPFTLDDYEPAAGIVNYVVQTQGSGAIIRDSVETSFDMDSPWLSVPTLQTLSRPVASVIAYDAMRDTRSTVIDIPGRSDPVVVLRVMGTRRGSLELFTKSYAESAAIISLCDRGEILMLRQPDHMGMDMYFTALSASVKVLQTSGPRSVFSVVLRYVETRFPVGALMSEPGWDFAGLAAENDRFTQIATEYRDFQAVAQHKKIEEA